jgi:hypothetical protein
MISWHEIRRFLVGVICICVIVLAGCKGGSDKVLQPVKETAPVEMASSADLKSLPTVTLTGTKILENVIESAVRVEITASGAFGSNVVRKDDPERIIIILHNAKKGEAPPIIAVNNGTINRVAIDQLNDGKGTAVRITIGLEHKADYLATPAVNGLLIDVRKRM